MSLRLREWVTGANLRDFLVEVHIPYVHFNLKLGQRNRETGVMKANVGSDRSHFPTSTADDATALLPSKRPSAILDRIQVLDRIAFDPS
jgi:hypothetical protein